MKTCVFKLRLYRCHFQKHLRIVDNLTTLYNRRMAFPRIGLRKLDAGNGFNYFGTVLGLIRDVNQPNIKMNKLPISIISAAIFMASCNSGTNKETALLKEKQFAIDSMKHVMEKKAIVDSMNTVMANREAEKKAEEARVAEAKNTEAVATSTAAPAERRKKGWNHTAKGAVVGAGTGAITGALVNKKRGEGALVGTLIGAGVGAGTGALVDNSQKKKRRNNN